MPVHVASLARVSLLRPAGYATVSAVAALALALAVVAPAQGVVPAALPAGPTVTGMTGARPNATRVSFPVSDQVAVSVDVGTGNLMVTTQGLSLPGIAGAVSVGETYNSDSTISGSTSTLQANGWALGLAGAGGLSAVTGGVVWTAGDGSTWMFTAASGSSTAFTTPAGLKAQLVATLSGSTVTGYTLTDLTSRRVASFDADGNAASVVDRNSNATTIATNYGQPTSITSPAGPTAARTAALSYSSTTHTLTVTQTNVSATRSVKYVKNAGSNLTGFVDAAGKTTSFTYTSGLLSSITSTTGAVTNISYDSTGKVAQIDQLNTSSGSPGTSSTRLTYPSATQTLLAGPNTSLGTSVTVGPHTSYTIDSDHLVISATDATVRVRARTYTPNLDVATATAGTGTTAGTTTAMYGANSGQSLTAVQAPGGATGHVTYANTSPATQYLPSSTTDDSGNQSLFTYNGPGNALTSTDAQAATATLTYNSDGTIATATGPGNGSNHTAYGHTDHQLTTITPPTGTSLAARTIGYDAFGRVATATDGRGITLSYSYDDDDRLLSTSFSDTTHTVTNTYDDAGRLNTMVSGSGTLTNTYDQLGRLTATVNTAGGGSESYSYDKASNLTSTTDSRGTTTNSYDASGVLLSTKYPHGGTFQHLYYTTDDQGRRTDEYMQSDSTKTYWQAHVHTSYDSSGRVSQVIAQTGSAPTTITTVFDTSYCYNTASAAPTCATGASTDRSKLHWSKDNLSGQVTAYSYDTAGRLLTATQTGGTGSNIYTYTYDSRGNRLTATVTGANPSTQTFTFNAANQITSTGYSYDGAGNLTSTPTAAYTYNGAEQMTRAVTGAITSNYAYAGTGQNRVLSESGSLGTINITYGRNDPQGQPVIEKYNVNTNQGYLYTDPTTGQPTMLTTSADQNGLYVLDGTGNPIGLLTSYNTNAFSYTYDPYGAAHLTAGGNGNGVTQNPYLFKTGIQDRASGLIKFGARWYNPATGTWTQQDTLDTPLTPANANRYAYAGDDPINLFDHSGQDVSASCWAQAGRLLLATGSVLLGAGSIVGLAIGFPAFFLSVSSEPQDAQGFLC